jgi:RNA:NAD 2'-phosphotransferase (TPT1/KptA family)
MHHGNPMDRELISTSRFLSLVLRHRPETIGITLDEQGWVEIDELLAAADRAGRTLTRPLLERVVRENDKQRFAISPASPAPCRRRPCRSRPPGVPPPCRGCRP